MQNACAMILLPAFIAAWEATAMRDCAYNQAGRSNTGTPRVQRLDRFPKGNLSRRFCSFWWVGNETGTTSRTRDGGTLRGSENPCLTYMPLICYCMRRTKKRTRQPLTFHGRRPTRSSHPTPIVCHKNDRVCGEHSLPCQLAAVKNLFPPYRAVMTSHGRHFRLTG
jgi:hypothetical protein